MAQDVAIDRKPVLDAGADRLDLLDLAGADQGRRRRPADGGDQAVFDLKADCRGERYPLFQPRFFAAGIVSAALAGDMHHDRPPHGARRVAGGPGLA